MRSACCPSHAPGSRARQLHQQVSLERVRRDTPEGLHHNAFWHSYALGAGDSRHLCQCRFSLRQPERHLHGAVELDGGGQGGAGLLPLAGLRIQGAEATVAVRLEWAHTEFVGQGQGLLVVGFGLRDIGRVGVGMDGAELVQRAAPRSRVPSAAGPGRALWQACCQASSKRPARR